MSNKLIITTSELSPGSRMIAYVQDRSLVEAHFSDEKEASRLHHIYVGKVNSISKNLQAAFIEIEKGVICYYPMEELSTAVFTKKVGKKPLIVGDELLVQVTKEGVKTKAPVVTTKLSIAGKYFVTDISFEGFRYSSKLSADEKKVLASYAEEFTQEKSSTELAQTETVPDATVETVHSSGFLFRTNSRFAPKEALTEEYLVLKEKMKRILEVAKYRTCYSLLYQPPKGVLNALLSLPEDAFEEIVTDDENEAKILKNETEKPVCFYEDDYRLSKLYNLDNQLMEATMMKVWLKSGAYLIIQPTEALVSIDVNTGKYEAGKNREETFLRINLEAAREIARQLRLRRLSGIIMIDFINMSEKKNEELLMRKLKEYFRPDPFRPVVVDMTKLGLVEVTRRKDEKTLYDYFKSKGIYPFQVDK